MPSKTPAQAKLMRIAANTKGGYDGIPQKVGKEFESADEAKAVKRTRADRIKSMYKKPEKKK